MTTLEEDILRQTRLTGPDGSQYRGGVKVSAGDAARTDATRARDAALDAEATGRQIGMPRRPAAPVISDSQLSTLNKRVSTRCPCSYAAGRCRGGFRTAPCAGWSRMAR